MFFSKYFFPQERSTWRNADSDNHPTVTERFIERSEPFLPWQLTNPTDIVSDNTHKDLRLRNKILRPVCRPDQMWTLSNRKKKDFILEANKIGSTCLNILIYEEIASNSLWNLQVNITPIQQERLVCASGVCPLSCGNLCKREQARASGKKRKSQKLNKTSPVF